MLNHARNNVNQLFIIRNIKIPVSFVLLKSFDVSRLNDVSTTSISELRGKRKDGLATRTTPDIRATAVME